MKLPYLLFAILLAMWAVIATTFVIGETPSVEMISEQTGEASRIQLGHGFTHPKFATMQSSGNGAARHERILWFGWAFGILQIAFFVTLVVYGGQKNGRLGPLKVPILVGGLLYAATFTAMVYAYQGYMLEQTHAMFLSLPVPTAWMIYGVWPVPLVFMFLYMFTFDAWIFREEDLTRFEEILAEKQVAVGKGSGGDQA
jgi:hypothetical protein